MKHWIKRNFPNLWMYTSTRWYTLLYRASLARMGFSRSRLGIELARNLIVDLRYGGYCGGKVRSRFSELGVHATQSAYYFQLAELFGRTGGISVLPDDVIVDVGCGKGRVMNFWLDKGFKNRMIGLEIDPDVAARTRRRLASYPNISIVTGDALENLPSDGTLFYLFNPFERAMTEAFQRRLLMVAREISKVRIVYFQCRFLDAFPADSWKIQPLSLKRIHSATLITPR